ncbi:MAG: hypothetical protein EOM59_16370 [Clostridia bacterium]|nr:hypothetical protein [Clostridia bacterium]
MQERIVKTLISNIEEGNSSKDYTNIVYEWDGNICTLYNYDELCARWVSFNDIRKALQLQFGCCLLHQNNQYVRIRETAIYFAAYKIVHDGTFQIQDCTVHIVMDFEDTVVSIDGDSCVYNRHTQLYFTRNALYRLVYRQ